MIDLSIVIVNYNTKEFLKNCLNSVMESTKNISFEIIVVDNASHDGSPEMVKKEFQNVRLIANEQNVGFSRANNQGIKISKDSRYVLFLNSDTIVHKDVLEEMVKFMDSHKDAGAATCKLVMPNGQIDDATHRGFPTPWNAFCHFSGLSKIARPHRFFQAIIWAGWTLIRPMRLMLWPEHSCWSDVRRENKLNGGMRIISSMGKIWIFVLCSNKKAGRFIMCPVFPLNILRVSAAE